MAKRTHPVKPLNEPVQVKVRHDSHGIPTAVELSEILPARAHGTSPGKRPALRRDYGKKRWLTVAKVEDMYEVDELWWRGEEQEIQRLYFELRLENARKVTIYCDLVRNLWYRQGG
jgi:hypothetical protein